MATAQEAFAYADAFIEVCKKQDAKDGMNKHITREDWLKAAVKLLTPKLEANGGVMPDKLHVLTSWPVSNAKKAVGMCFAKTWTKDESTYICISPVLGEEDLPELLGTLLHELVHAVVGVEHNHNKHFKKMALKVGLTGKMRSTENTPELVVELGRMMMELGSYPHSTIMPPKPKQKKKGKKQILKFSCPDHPTYSCWLTPAQAREVGPPISPLSGKKMVGDPDEPTEEKDFG